MKNEPALRRCRGRRGRGPCPCRGAGRAPPRGRRPAARGRRARHAERPRQLGVADRAPTRRPAGRRKLTREHDPAARVALEARSSGRRSRSPRRAERRRPRRCAGRARARGDRLGDLLAVGADVLDRRGADRARDAGQALDARAARRPTQRATSASHGSPAATATTSPSSLDAARQHAHDGAGEALVGDDDVAAAGQDEQRLAGGVGARTASTSSSSVRASTTAPGRAAEPQRRQLGERTAVTSTDARGGRARAARRRPAGCAARRPPAATAPARSARRRLRAARWSSLARARLAVAARLARWSRVRKVTVTGVSGAAGRRRCARRSSDAAPRDDHARTSTRGQLRDAVRPSSRSSHRRRRPSADLAAQARHHRPPARRRRRAGQRRRQPHGRRRRRDDPARAAPTKGLPLVPVERAARRRPARRARARRRSSTLLAPPRRRRCAPGSAASRSASTA